VSVVGGRKRTVESRGEKGRGEARIEEERGDKEETVERNPRLQSTADLLQTIIYFLYNPVYLRGMKRDEWVAPIPGRPWCTCL
jgi:hypothetical protein